jgi:hypothetical protein
MLAVLVVKSGQKMFGGVNLAEPHKDDQLHRPRRRDGQMRCVQVPGQPLGGAEGGQRIQVPAAC